jgi:hypothetical protein
MQLQYDIKIMFTTYLLRILFCSQKFIQASFMKFHVWNVCRRIYIIAIWGWGVKCKLITRVTREHVIGGKDFASQIFCSWIRLKSYLIPCSSICKSWIKYHKWNLDEYFLRKKKCKIKFQVWSLFHPWNIVEFNPWKFIDRKFTNDISWMFIHKMESYILIHYVCLWLGFGGWGRERPVKQRAGHGRRADWLAGWFTIKSFSLFLLGWPARAGWERERGWLADCLYVCRGPETQITFKTVSPNSRAQKLFRTSITHFYFFTYRVLSPDQSRSQVPTPRLQITYWGAYGQRAER